MRIKGSTLALLLTATLLAGGVLITDLVRNSQGEQQAGSGPGNSGPGNSGPGDPEQPNAATPKTKALPLFPFQESEITAFTLQRPDLTLKFAQRNPPDTAKPKWQMLQPEALDASDGAVAYLLNLLATESSRETFSMAGDRKAEFGLDRPTAIVNVTLQSGQSHVFVLGAPNFNSTQFYALTDTPPNADPLPIQVVTSDFGPAVTRPLAEWKYTAEAPPQS